MKKFKKFLRSAHRFCKAAEAVCKQGAKFFKSRNSRVASWMTTGAEIAVSCAVVIQVVLSSLG